LTTSPSDSQERERQASFAGAVSAIEAMLENNYIKTEDIDKVKSILKTNIQRITIEDILLSVVESR